MKVRSRFVCFILVLVFVFSSFANVSAVPSYDNNKTKLLNSFLAGQYSYWDLVKMFLEDVPGYNSSFLYDSVLMMVYGLGNSGTGISSPNPYSLYILNSTIGVLSAVNAVQKFVNGVVDGVITYSEQLETSYGAKFYYYPTKGLVCIVCNGVCYNHYFNDIGNPLTTGTDNGLYSVNDYYQSVYNSGQSSVDSNLLAKAVSQGLISSGAISLLQMIASGSAVSQSVITSDNQLSSSFRIGGDTSYGDLIYSPDLSTYYYHTENYTYEITNNYNYTHINYYMPGADTPFQQANYYYELPDGRNSATLTASEIMGLSTGFDVVNYTQVASDPFQKALFHFDGTNQNVAPNNPLVLDSVVLDIPRSSVFRGSLNFTVPESGYYIFVFGNNYGWDCYAVSFDKSCDLFSNFDYRFGSGYSGNSYVVYLSSGSHYVYLYSESYDGSCYVLSASKGSWTVPDTIVNVGTPTALNFTFNPSYTYVDTGTVYNSALYLDGLSHNFNVNLLPGCIKSDLDWTLSFRWYQEVSSSSAVHSVSVGGTDSTAPFGIYFDGDSVNSIWAPGVNSGNAALCDIPVGTWNTFTLVRSANNLLFYFNGLLKSTLTFSGSSSNNLDSLGFNFANDSNVKYFDELMFCNKALYTNNSHTPRLQPYDSANVLVAPDVVSSNSICIKSILPVNGYRVGGVRPVYPASGFVYVYLENNLIKSIQQFDGSGWVECQGVFNYNGHNYSTDNFNVPIKSQDIDGNQTIIQDIDNSQNTTNINISLGGILGFLGDIAEALADIVDSVVGGISDIVKNVVTALTSVFTDLLNLFKDAVSGFVTGVTNVFQYVGEGIGNLGSIGSEGAAISSVFSAFPTEFKQFFVSAILILVGVSIFMRFLFK